MGALDRDRLLGRALGLLGLRCVAVRRIQRTQVPSRCIDPRRISLMAVLGR